MESLKTYTTGEVAEILKVTQRSVYNYLKADQIKGIRVGREYRFTEEAIKDFMAKGTDPDYLEKLGYKPRRKKGDTNE